MQGNFPCPGSLSNSIIHYPAKYTIKTEPQQILSMRRNIIVVCDPEKLNDLGCNGAPDWIIEIASPESFYRDYGVKLFKYHDSCVREYWIVNPMDQTITVYFFERGTSAQHYTFEDKIKVNIYDNLEIDFATLNL